MAITLKNQTVMKSCWLLATVFLLCLPLSCTKKDTEADHQHNLVLAESYFNQGQIQASIIELKNALQKQPDNHAALRQMGKLLMFIGDYSHAAKNFRRATEIEPNNVATQLDLVEALLRQKKKRAATDQLQQIATPINPELSTRLLVLKAKLALLSEQFSTANQLYQQAKKQAPKDSSVLLGLAQLSAAQKDFAQMDAYSQQAYENDPSNTDILLWLSSIALAKEQYAKAEGLLSNLLLELSNLDIMTTYKYLALNGMVKAMIGQGKTEDALHYSEKLADSPQSKLAARYKEAIDSYQKGDLLSAEEQFKNILSIAPGQNQAETALGLIKLQQGSLSSAEAYLLEATNDTSIHEFTQAHKLLAWTQLKLSKPQEVVKLVTSALEKNPNDAELLSLKAVSLLQINKIEEGKTYLNKAFEADSDHIPTRLVLARMALKESKIKEAKQHYQHIITLEPNHPVALKGWHATEKLISGEEQALNYLISFTKNHKKHINPHLTLISSYLSKKQFAKAQQAAAKVVKIFPNNKQATSILTASFYLESYHFYQQQNWHKASSSIKKALAVSPKNLALRLMSVRIEMKSSSPQEIAASFKQLQSHYPKSAQPFILEGDWQKEQNNIPLALAAYKKAWELNKNQFLALKYFYTSQKHNQNPDVSLAHLIKWQTENPELIAANIALAFAYQDLKMYKQSIQFYEQVINLNNQHTVALNNLSSLYLEINDKQRALTVAKEAYSLAPEHPAILDTYGWALTQFGQPEQGLPLLQKAHKKSPQAEITKHLKTTLTRLGRTEEASKL